MMSLPVIEDVGLREVALRDDPYLQYRLLHQHGDIVYLEKDKMWLVMSHTLVKLVLRDYNVFGSHLGVLFDRDDFYDASEVPLFAQVPPGHTLLRQAMATAFSPKTAQEFEEACLQHAHRAILRDSAQGSTVEIVSQMILPYVTSCLCCLLQMSAAEQRAARVIFDALLGPSEDDRRESPMDVARRHIGSALQRIASDAQRGEVASVFVDFLRRDAASLVDSKLNGLLSLALFAGFEDMIRMLANLVYLEVSHTDRTLLENPNAIDHFIMEAMRHSPSTHFLRRTARTDVVLNGTRIAQGEKVVVAIAHANRDPAIFNDPDSFTPGRANGSAMLTFGNGPHVCVGRHLARMMLRVFLKEWTAMMGGKRVRFRSSSVICQNNIVGFRSLTADLMLLN